MAVFDKMSGAPWSKVFHGSMSGYMVEMYSNEEKIILNLIYERKEGKTIGAVVQMHAPFKVEGNVSAFIDSMNFPATALIQHEQESLKFLLASTQAQYVNWNENEFLKATKAMLEELKANSKTTSSMASGSPIKLTAVKDLPNEIKESFFSNPLMISALSTSAKKAEAQEESKQEKEDQQPFHLAAATASQQAGKVLIGELKDGKKVEEPVNLFKKIVVSEGNELTRKHLNHVLVEGILLSNIGVSAFEFGSDFQGMSTPTKKLDELKKHGLEIEPVGFPVKVFNAPAEIKIDINLLKAESLMDLIGVKDKNLINLLQSNLSGKQFNNLDELIQEIKKTTPSSEINQYQINKLIRIIQIQKEFYPNYFGGKNQIEEISKAWVKALGRIGILNVSSLIDGKSKILLIYTLLKGIYEHYRKQGTSSNVKTVIAIPKANLLFGKSQINLISRELNEVAGNLSQYGVGIIIELDHANDLNDELKKTVNGNFSIVSGTDVGIKFEGKNQYRATIRPTLSTQVEGE